MEMYIYRDVSNVTVHGVDGGVLDANLCDGRQEGDLHVVVVRCVEQQLDLARAYVIL